MTRKNAERQESLNYLNTLIKRGDTIYTVLRSVSRSGMQRTLDLYAIVDGQPMYLSGHAAKVADLRRNKEGAIVISGCGTDVGFEAVYNLSMAMFCRDAEGNYKYDHDSAYALKHSWL
jgi:hypothetical protein